MKLKFVFLNLFLGCISLVIINTKFSSSVKAEELLKVELNRQIKKGRFLIGLKQYLGGENDNFSKKWSIAGKSEIVEINKKIGCSIPEGTDYHTLAGFMLEKFQMVPKIGDVLDFNNIKFEVISMSGPKIDRVKIILPNS